MKTNLILPIASGPTNEDDPLCSGIFQCNPSCPKTLFRAKVPKSYYVLVLNCPSGCSTLLPEHISRRISLFRQKERIRRKNKKKKQREKKSTSENESETAPNGRRQIVDAKKARRTLAAREEDVPGKAERL